MNRTYKYQVRLVSPVEERNCNKLCSTTIVHQYSEMVFSPTNFESFFYMAETICSFFLQYCRGPTQRKMLSSSPSGRSVSDLRSQTKRLSPHSLAHLLSLSWHGSLILSPPLLHSYSSCAALIFPLTQRAKWKVKNR